MPHNHSNPLKAVFLDRDGTLNPDPGYLSDASQLKLFDGVKEALTLLKESDFELFIVTNQSGIGRGLITNQQLAAIHKKLNEELLNEASKITDFGICPHHPDEDCDCRKPKTKLIVDLDAKWNIDLSQSFMVGDKSSDLQLGRNANLKASCLVRTGYGKETESQIQSTDADFVGDDLLSVAQWIVERSKTSS